MTKIYTTDYLHSDRWETFLGIYYVDQDGLKINLRDQPVSVSQMLGLKVCATTIGLIFYTHKILSLIQPSSPISVFHFKAQC